MKWCNLSTYIFENPSTLAWHTEFWSNCFMILFLYPTWNFGSIILLFWEYKFTNTKYLATKNQSLNTVVTLLSILISWNILDDEKGRNGLKKRMLMVSFELSQLLCDKSINVFFCLTVMGSSISQFQSVNLICMYRFN